jgi:EAL domain-containing protein (putative c-di-GMP-specific phosphodiesterase class I)/GGDEF domain-containing protein
MEKDNITALQAQLLSSRPMNFVFSVIVIGSLPLIYLIVYETGGIKYVFSHTMYIPIIFAGIFWGFKGGAFIGIIGGLMLGPIMPIDTITGEKQQLINWIYRTIYFFIVGGTVGTFSDFLKEYIKKIHYISTHNSETGLYNMVSLNLDKVVSDFLEKKTKINVLSISWNNIDEIINNFGIRICVSVIKELNERMIKIFNEKFIFIHSDISKFYALIECDQPKLCLNQIEHLISEPFIINNIPFYAEFTVGLAEYDKSDSDLNPFQKANMATLYAKKSGVSSSIFNDVNIKITKNNLILLGEFPAAIQNNQTILYYQPKIDLHTKKTIGMEALIRWNHPEKGMICPADFIPLVEESNLIHPLTDFVLNESLSKLHEFNENGYYPTISINISPKNIANPSFLDRVALILDQHDVKKECIELEITESSLMFNPEKVNLILRSFKNHNIKLSIDDFGTGYSSLSYLSRFPIDIIKLDQFFIRQLSLMKGTYYIVESAINLAHNLGLKIIAEGIEDTETEKMLIDMGCDMGQGYLYSKPLNDQDISSWIEKNN